MLPDLLADLPDPRRQTRNELHSQQDIVIIALCALIRRLLVQSAPAENP